MGTSYSTTVNYKYNFNLFVQSGTQVVRESYYNSGGTANALIQLQNQANAGTNSSTTALQSYSILISIPMLSSGGRKVNLTISLLIEQTCPTPTDSSCYRLASKNMSITEEATGFKYNYHYGSCNLSIPSLPSSPTYTLISNISFLQPTVQTMKLELTDVHKCNNYQVVNPAYSISIMDGTTATGMFKFSGTSYCNGIGYYINADFKWNRPTQFNAQGQLQTILPKGTILTGYAQSNGYTGSMVVTSTVRCTTTVETIANFPNAVIT